VQQFARHGDIRRAHRTSTKTMQDAIQRARACARRNAPMHELFDVHIARRIASCADLYNVRTCGSRYSRLRYSAGSRQRHLSNMVWVTGPQP